MHRTLLTTAYLLILPFPVPPQSQKYKKNISSWIMEDGHREQKVTKVDLVGAVIVTESHPRIKLVSCAAKIPAS